MKILLISLFILLGTNTIAQDNQINQDTLRSEIVTRSSRGMTNEIKWDVGMLGRGIFILNYEHAVFSWLSPEIGLGITHTDFIYAGEVATGIFPYTYSYDRTSRYGFAYSGALRFYPRKMDNMKGIYLSLGVQGRYFRFSSPKEKDFDGYSEVNMYDARFVGGWQKQSEYVEDLTWDLYFGVGIRTIKDHYYDADKRSMEIGSSEHPILIAGVKLGLPF